MRRSDGPGTCRNCGREYPADRLDRLRWCDRCRLEVVRRSARAARATALVVTLALMAWIWTVIGSSPRFLMGWVVAVVAVYYFVYKLAQRVAFEVIRGRGVPPPPED